LKNSTGYFEKDGIAFYTAETDDLAICVCPEKGGELSSVRYKKLLPGKELLFRGNDYSTTDERFKGRAPLMWPAVTRNYLPEHLPLLISGGTPPCSYLYKDKVYEIGPSAFAKDVPWQFGGIDGDGRILSQLESSPATRARYPFEFCAMSSFRIEGTRVIMEYAIYSKDPEPMFFSIGNHIGINIPFGPDSTPDDVLLQSSGTHMRHISKQGQLEDSYTELPLAEGLTLNGSYNVFNMVTSGYTYADNFFRITDKGFCFEIRHRVNTGNSRGAELPPETELHYTLYGNRERGFICPEPWIGGINSLNTGRGLIHLDPGGCFHWEIAIQLKKTQGI
jgi:galactose mutarotase-like enzyme